MRHPGRRFAPPLNRGSAWLRLLAGAAFLLAGLGLAEAREVSVRGIPEKGFGRIELAFDQATKVKVRSSGAVLVISFSDPARFKAEKLPAELASYISAARRDPDGTGIRLALNRPFQISQLEAGERVYIDLLPERWTGLPPGLPPDVVADLAERARRAEARLREAAARRAGLAKPVVLRLAQSPDQTRFVFDAPIGTPTRLEEQPGATELRFEGNLTLDLSGNRPKSAEGVADFTFDQDEDGLTIRIAAKPGRVLRSFVEEGSAVVALSTPAALPEPAPAAAAPVLSEPPVAPPPPPVREAATRPAPVAPPPPLPPRREPDPFVLPLAEAPTAPTQTIRLRKVGSAEDPSVVVPFARTTPAAAFERGRRTTIVFQTSDKLDLDDIDPAGREALGLRSLRQDGPFAILTLETPPERALRLVQEGSAWRIALGGTATPPDDVLVTRSVGQDGRGEVVVALAGAAVHWLLDADDVPLAVVTTSARQGLANSRRFVEFQLLPTMQGIVVQPSADQVQVALGRGGVVITRRSGLALSATSQAGVEADRHPFVIRPDEWQAETSGDVYARYRAFVAAAAEASRAGKAEIRFQLARMLLASGLAHEAGSMLAAASADDPVFARRRDTLLLSGIAALRAHRPKQARAFLSDEALVSDPEAGLWRAAADAEDRDWPRALAGLRRAEAVLMRYPDDLAGAFRLMTARAGAATGDIKAAEDALAAIDRLPLGAVERDELDLVRASVDEAAGRSASALAIYARLEGETVSRPISAAATLRAVQLGRKTARMQSAEATTRLEALSVMWRGDETELGTLGQLVKLYGESKRWRDMLQTARLTQTRFAGHDEARRIYDEAAAWFEGLFLGQDGAAVDPVEFLALYYDFKEFAPAGRRGDQIVRRIADRLVEIDLLEQAANLLQHQVDHRLSGIAKVTIATRLAALRLMSGKPGMALTALHATRLTDLPVPLRRLRLIIEAQAQADLSRVDLALEAVDGEQGADFARLRATIYFGARRWREAGEAFESLLGTRWKEADPLSDEERQDVIRAMLADVLAQEPIALGRIRSKFAPKMADSADAKLFDTLLKPRAVQSAEFRAALREASRSDSLRRFLADWASVSDLPPEAFGPSGKAAGTAGGAKPG